MNPSALWAASTLLAVGASCAGRPGGTAHLVVDPAEVRFLDVVPRAEPYLKTVAIRNVSGRPLVVSASVAGGPAFELANAAELRARPLVPGGTAAAAVLFLSGFSTARTGELRIEAEGSRITIPLSAVAALPRIAVRDCVRIRPDATDCFGDTEDRVVEFGDVGQGRCRKAEITVESVGIAPLEVSRVTLSEGAGPDLHFVGDEPAPFTLAPIGPGGSPQRKVIEIEYCPVTRTSSAAALRIESNAPGSAVEVALRGSYVTDTGWFMCTCSPSTIEVAPLDTITLSGAGCTDPDAPTPPTYRWEVLERPEGSTSAIQNPGERDARFFVDLATAPERPYRFRFTVTDSWGLSSSCGVTVYATPRDSLQVQLVWPRDSVDMDLHLLNPIGSANPTAATGWFDLTNDCHYLNRIADWGVVGNSQDNARLDIDDVNGFGPENVSISRPQSGTFTVGVHYFCDDDQGASDATVRIYCNGLQMAEFTRTLPSSGSFWEVATVIWPGCTITALDEATTVSQGCQGFTFP